MDSQLKKGLLDVCVLSVLRRGESYGYKILSDVAPCIEIAESTLYPILKRLEAAGCVRSRTEAHNGRLRKYFTITAQGEEKIREFLQDAEMLKRIYAFIADGGIT